KRRSSDLQFIQADDTKKRHLRRMNEPGGVSKERLAQVPMPVGYVTVTARFGVSVVQIRKDSFCHHGLCGRSLNRPKDHAFLSLRHPHSSHSGLTPSQS